MISVKVVSQPNNVDRHYCNKFWCLLVFLHMPCFGIHDHISSVLVGFIQWFHHQLYSSIAGTELPGYSPNTEESISYWQTVHLKQSMWIVSCRLRHVMLCHQVGPCVLLLKHMCTLRELVQFWRLWHGLYYVMMCASSREHCACWTLIIHVWLFSCLCLWSLFLLVSP